MRIQLSVYVRVDMCKDIADATKTWMYPSSKLPQAAQDGFINNISKQRNIQKVLPTMQRDYISNPKVSCIL